MPNVENAKLLLGIVQDNLERFNMECFIGGNANEVEITRERVLNTEDNLCGTTFCLAGFAAVLNGWEIKASPRDRDLFRHPDARPHFSPERPHWEGEGEKFLGISSELAEELFFSSNETALKALTMLAEGHSNAEVRQYLEEA